MLLWLNAGGYDVGQHLCNAGSAAADVRNVRPHGIFTLCESFQVQAGIGGGKADQCLAYSTGTGKYATLNTNGIGVGLGDSAFFGVSINFYDTDRIKDVGGHFEFANSGGGVIVGGVPLAGGVSAETGNGRNGVVNGRGGP